MNKDIPVGKKMTDKEKIAQIIAEHLCPQGKSHKRLYGAERMCYSRDNFAECEKVSKCVDALIAAGIGDVAAHKAEAEYWEKICKFESVEYHTTIKNAAEHARHLMQERDEYKHRAEVAEKDLERHKRALYCACKASATVVTKELVKARVDCFLRKAERDLTEGKKQ